jgi:hypothetical protein
MHLGKMVGMVTVFYDGPDMKVLNNRLVFANPSYEYLNKWFQYGEFLTIKDMESVNDAGRTDPQYKNLDILKDAVDDSAKTNGDTPNVQSKNKQMKGLQDYMGRDEYNKPLLIITERRPDRCDLRKELFSYEDGECGKRGANEIINLMEGKIISKKGILFHSYETSRANNSKIYYSYPKLLEENIKYKKLLSENFYISPDIIILTVANRNSKKNFLPRSHASSGTSISPWAHSGFLACGSSQRQPLKM